MQQTPIKPNKLASIPTELNYITLTNKRIKKLRQQGNTSRLWIIFLILWNIFLTSAVIPNSSPIPQFTDKQNEQIMMLEEIPMEVLEVE